MLNMAPVMSGQVLPETELRGGKTFSLASSEVTVKEVQLAKAQKTHLVKGNRCIAPLRCVSIIPFQKQLGKKKKESLQQ